MRIHLIRKGGGKIVTVVRGYKGNKEGLKSLGKYLQSSCSTGGTFKQNEISLQGDFREKVKNLLMKKLGSSVRVIEDSTRSQNRNRNRALQRMEKILITALHVEKKRKPTKPSRKSNERRLEVKKRRSDLKADRKPPELN